MNNSRPVFHLITTIALLSAVAHAGVPESYNRRGAPPVAAAAPATPAPAETSAAPVIPPAPEGVTDLEFNDFFKMPVGAYGLELTEKLKSLDGKRVRILGYMVREDHAADEGEGTGIVPGRFMLTHLREAVSFPHYGVCDDLPPQTVFVTAPDYAGKEVPHIQQPLLLTGTLSVGNKQEEDGRISGVRLTLDPAPEADKSKLTK